MILGIESFEKKYVILKGLFQSDQLEQHMVTIGIDQLLSNSALYEDRCLKNINKLYKSYGKFYDQHHYKNILEYSILSTPEMFADNGPISPGPSVTVKIPMQEITLSIYLIIWYQK